MPNQSLALDNSKHASLPLPKEGNEGACNSEDDTKPNRKSTVMPKESEDAHPATDIEEMKVQREYSKSSSTSSFSIAGSLFYVRFPTFLN